MTNTLMRRREILIAGIAASGLAAARPARAAASGVIKIAGGATFHQGRLRLTGRNKASIPIQGWAHTHAKMRSRPTRRNYYADKSRQSSRLCRKLSRCHTQEGNGGRLLGLVCRSYQEDIRWWSPRSYTMWCNIPLLGRDSSCRSRSRHCRHNCFQRRPD